MKNKYLLILSLVSSFAFAQQTISFEPSEGYTAGDINGQNGWEVTLNNDEAPINNQTISTEKAFEGTQSLKISVDDRKILVGFLSMVQLNYLIELIIFNIQS